MFHPPNGGHKRREAKIFQYWALFLSKGQRPIALFEKHDVAVMFKETMTDGQCSIQPYSFRPEP